MKCTPSSDKLGKAPYIKKRKPPRNNKKFNVFMVGDIETLRYPMGKDGIDSHLAYAAGYMVVTPGRKPVKGDINRYYAEDYKPILLDPLERRPIPVHAYLPCSYPDTSTPSISASGLASTHSSFWTVAFAGAKR